jgi:predicted small metal-binding protein
MGTITVNSVGWGMGRSRPVQAQLSEDQREGPKLTFRCGDLRIKECTWQTEGNTEHEVLSRIEEHFRENHNFAFDLAAQTLVRQAIRKQAAQIKAEPARSPA